MRNNRTNTSVAAYSARARESATVSMPIDWSQLSARLKPERFTVETVGRKALSDPWKDCWKTKQKISKASFDAIKRL